MSQINTEAAFASNKANSSTAVRTADYAFAGVNQSTPYAFSEFHGKTYAYGNTATLYYYYPFDGGNGYNNPQIWGWNNATNAEARVPNGGPWTHTVYFSGSLANGTLLWCDQDPALGRYQSLIDEGYENVNPGGYPGWYYITDGTSEWVCTTSTSSPTFTVSSLTLLNWDVTWNYFLSAMSGGFTIEKNGTNVVNQTAQSSGTVNVTSAGTDYLYTTVTTSATFPLNAEANLYIVDDGTVIYNNSQVNYGFASNSYGTWYPTGDGSISADSIEV